MIRFRLRELVADLEFRRGGRVTLEEIAASTGIHRTTLTKIALKRGYNTTTNNLDRLCQFFGCPLDKLAEFIPESVVSPAVGERSLPVPKKSESTKGRAVGTKQTKRAVKPRSK